MKLITLDFETYYDKKYSLSKLTTEEYIRHPEFEVIGVAVKQVSSGPGETKWFSGTKERTKDFLDQFDWDNCLVVAHNAMFDMAILSWIFGIKPKRVADTLSMSRAIHSIEVGGSLKALAEYYQLGEKGTEVVNALGKRRIDFTDEELARYAEYCINDVELTEDLFKVLLPKLNMLELKLIDLTIKMFSEPALELDIDVLEAHLQGVQKKKQDLMAKIEADKKVIMSNPKFAELLQNNGIIPPKKISPTTGKETYAFAKTDEEFKALLEHENSDVQALVSARLGVKSTIEETRTERFINIAMRGTLPIPLRYYAAHTGRWGGDDKVNMQNLPRTSALKDAICAPFGYRIIDCDSSQIEARTLAWLAEQNDLVDAFDKGEDVYKIMASSIYGKPVEEITKDERFVGKTTILGAGYGMGARKFQAQLKNFGVELPEDECQRIITVYREQYQWIPQLWRDAGKALEAMMNDQTTEFGRNGLLCVEGNRGIRLPNGLYIQYPNIRKERNEDGDAEVVYDTRRGKMTVPNRIYGGKVIENVCQALARIVIGEQMLEIAKRYKVVMTVHDAVACIVPKEEEEEGRAFVEKMMRMRPTWAQELPLDCESGVGKSYGDCK
jgi:DNA polymerase